MEIWVQNLSQTSFELEHTNKNAIQSMTYLDLSGRNVYGIGLD